MKKMLKVEELNPENVWLKCRLIQRQTGCSHKAIKSMINSVCGKIPRATMVKMDKKLIDVGGGLCLQLNGCDNCNRHVFLPSSKETCCPKCGGARFDDKGKPKEVCQYFPLRKQIEKLLGLPAFINREKSDLPDIHKDLVRGLVMMTGSLPFSSLKPVLHHIVHYAVLTSRYGSLRFCVILNT